MEIFSSDYSFNNRYIKITKDGKKINYRKRYPNCQDTSLKVKIKHEENSLLNY